MNQFAVSKVHALTSYTEIWSKLKMKSNASLALAPHQLLSSLTYLAHEITMMADSPGLVQVTILLQFSLSVFFFFTIVSKLGGRPDTRLHRTYSNIFFSEIDIIVLCEFYFRSVWASVMWHKCHKNKKRPVRIIRCYQQSRKSLYYYGKFS